MPTYTDGGRQIEIHRRVTMLDANVLVAAFSPREGRRHSDAIAFIENPDDWQVTQWLVPLVIVAEAWGLFTKNKDRAGALQMLQWLSDPGNPVTFCRYVSDSFDRAPPIGLRDVVEGQHVDVVDALLLAIAEDISTQCNLRPPMQIATFDWRDFPRLRRHLGARVRLFDMNSLEAEDDVGAE